MSDPPLRQLPMDIGEFTGREAELQRLTAIVDECTGVAVVSVEGMPGVGKTRFAVHAAHGFARAGRFDEIQLWSDLRGFDPARPSADPADVLESFLRLLGVPGPAIPRTLQDRAALYRARLAGRRTLVLLDNAADEEQVLPLLPGEDPSLVLVTTRHRMSELPGERLPLDTFSRDEAVALLARIAGEERVGTDAAAAERVAELSGHLPLVLALAARRLRARPAWGVADLAGLIEAHGRAAIEPGGAAGGTVGASIAISYRGLTDHRQRLFRLLTLHPGADATPASVAALVRTTPAEAEADLEHLLDEHLLQQEVAGRYRFHDLIREYAAEVALAAEPEEARNRARQDCLAWYLHAADAAVQTLEPHRRRAFDLEGAPGAELPGFDTAEQALAWCDAERTNLVAAVHLAAEADLPAFAWQLPAVLLRYFYRRSHWADWFATHHVALDRVRQSGDRRAEATIVNGLGVAHGDLHQYDESIDHCLRAADLFAAAGDGWGQAWSLNNAGVTSVEQGDPATGERSLRTALPLFRQCGDPQGVATCLNNLGDCYRLMDRTEDAIAALQEAIEIPAEADRSSQRYPLGTLGDVYRDTGRYDLAVSHYERALEAHRAAGDQRAAGRVLHSLGDALAAGGRVEEARRRLREARSLLDELGSPEAGTIELPARSLDDRQQRLVRRIRSYAEAHLADPALTPETIAAAHHISLRYLYKLFQADGVTVAAWVRQRRLEHCERDLVDPAQADRPASAIAAGWGFTDPAHFSRAFRAQYGAAPGEYRRTRRR